MVFKQVSYRSPFLQANLSQDYKSQTYLHAFKAKTGPFRRFSRRMWQNAHTNTVRCATECNVYFPFSKILKLY